MRQGPAITTADVEKLSQRGLTYTSLASLGRRRGLRGLVMIKGYRSELRAPIAWAADKSDEPALDARARDLARHLAEDEERRAPLASGTLVVLALPPEGEPAVATWPPMQGGAGERTGREMIALVLMPSTARPSSPPASWGGHPTLQGSGRR